MRFATLALVCFFIITLTVASQGQNLAICPGAPASRLVVGEQGRVAREQPHRLRQSPSTESETITEMPPNATFTVRSGPSCGEDFAWWYIEFGGLLGWSAESGEGEYWLEPIGESLFSIPTRTPPAPSFDLIAHENVSFFLPGEIALSASGETVEAGDTIPNPEHIAFTFEGYIAGEMLPASLRVFSAEAYSEQRGGSLRTLGALLEARPENPLPVNQADIDGDFIFFTQAAYVDFANGSGVRYLEHSTSSILPVLDEDIYYVFTGLTDDRQYYVEAVFPLLSDLLPGQDLLDNPRFDLDTLVEDYDSYLDAMDAMLTNAPQNSFVPSLASLDALIGSLGIGVDARPISQIMVASPAPTGTAQAATPTAPDTTVVPTTTAATPSVVCVLTAFADTNVRDEPLLSSKAVGYMPANVPIAADAQFERLGEGINWWRLVPGAPLALFAGEPSGVGRWIRADFVREEGDCDALPSVE
ncbi:MAG: SH3 domain-containing protein [bacterium]|nr:SH3 domain-containing protein [bacterium]